MKKSSFFLFGMLAALLAFGIVLAGCEGPAGPAFTILKRLEKRGKS